MTPEQRRLRAQIAANTRWSGPVAREDAADTARSAFYALSTKSTRRASSRLASATASCALPRGHSLHG
jgi:hypothetical protein